MAGVCEATRIPATVPGVADFPILGISCSTGSAGVEAVALLRHPQGEGRKGRSSHVQNKNAAQYGEDLETKQDEFPAKFRQQFRGTQGIVGDDES